MILRNLKSLIRRYPVAVVLNFTGLVAAVLSFIHSFSYLPGIDATILRGEEDADFEDLAFVVSKPVGIGLFLNLLKGGLGSIVYLDLNDVDILPGLEPEVHRG